MGAGMALELEAKHGMNRKKESKRDSERRRREEVTRSAPSGQRTTDLTKIKWFNQREQETENEIVNKERGREGEKDIVNQERGREENKPGESFYFSLLSSGREHR